MISAVQHRFRHVATQSGAINGAYKYLIVRNVGILGGYQICVSLMSHRNDAVNEVDSCQSLCRLQSLSSSDLHMHTPQTGGVCSTRLHVEGTARLHPSCLSFLFHWVCHHLKPAASSGVWQHFAALSNMLGQLYPRPSGARSLWPLNLPNYASHQLFSRSIAVIPELLTLTLCLSPSTSFLSLCILDFISAL